VRKNTCAQGTIFAHKHTTEIIFGPVLAPDRRCLDFCRSAALSRGARRKSTARYLWVLAVLPGLTAGLALPNLGPLNTILAVGIAMVKTALVMSVFMHATEGRNLTRSRSAACRSIS